MLVLKKTAASRQQSRERAKRWAGPLTSASDRRAAWASMLFADHGFIRLLYGNRRRVDGNLWRSAQPSPFDIAWARRRGVRTVISLRNGLAFGSWPLEQEACRRAGIELVIAPIYSREAPSAAMVLNLAEIFRKIEYPTLIHCKSGADRAGLAAAIYLLVVKRVSAREALGQLGLKYGHIRWGKTGILDEFLRAYAREGEANGLGFLDWVAHHYDPAAVERSFRSAGWADVIVDRVLRRE